MMTFKNPDDATEAACVACEQLYRAMQRCAEAIVARDEALDAAFGGRTTRAEQFDELNDWITTNAFVLEDEMKGSNGQSHTFTKP
jgi:hypothetical protein